MSNLAVLIVGAFLAPARFMFGLGTVRWLAFGAGGSVIVMVAGAFLARGRGGAQRLLDLGVALTGAWTVVSALTFSAGTVGWLALGEGGAAAVLAAVGLIAHQAIMERAVVSRRSATISVDDDGDGATAPPRSAPVAVGPWPS